MLFFDASVIISDRTALVPGAGLYHFGILTSAVDAAYGRRFADGAARTAHLFRLNNFLSGISGD